MNHKLAITIFSKRMMGVRAVSFSLPFVITADRECSPHLKNMSTTLLKQIVL